MMPFLVLFLLLAPAGNTKCVDGSMYLSQTVVNPGDTIGTFSLVRNCGDKQARFYGELYLVHPDGTEEDVYYFQTTIQPGAAVQWNYPVLAGAEAGEYEVELAISSGRNDKPLQEVVQMFLVGAR